MGENQLAIFIVNECHGWVVDVHRAGQVHIFIQNDLILPVFGQHFGFYFPAVSCIVDAYRNQFYVVFRLPIGIVFIDSL